MNPKTSLKNLPGIAPKYTKILEKIGLFTVEDLLLYFPFRYDDFRKTVTLSTDFLDQVITIEGTVIKTKLNRIFKRKMTVAEVLITDENETPLKIVWFNQPYILDSLIIGSSIRVSGKLAQTGKFFTMTTPAWEKASRDETNTGRLVPVYSETIGLTSKWIRWQIQPLLPLAKKLPDFLPDDIREKYHLYSLEKAVKERHFPTSPENLLRAEKTFAFREMFLIQLKTLEVKSQWEKNKAVQIKFDEALIKNFVSKLPFSLTNAQRKATFEILKDLEKPRPMNRLLNGDVGAGKTIVAATAALQVLSVGCQAAIMAPTEVLARQHFESFCKIFEGYNFDIALLTNSYKLVNKKSEFNSEASELNSDFSPSKFRRNELLKEISAGKINLIIGTHALIQKDVAFKNLALVVIDEQHRFGVAQRAALQQDTLEIHDGKIQTIPHLLTMTATPIPRTLAIAFFGSLELSILDEMPKNRKPIITKVVSPNGRNQIYQFIRNEIQSGRQTFIIFPFVEESKAITEVKAAVAEHQRLSQKVFPELRLGLLHGKLKAKEKEMVMQDFKDKKLDILVSTSVVEVGIDVPNATVMIIENAERFGLSQLHQFRGRVGRGEHQSYCFLFSEKDTKASLSRLSVMEKTNDGFKIAEADLKQRGAGQFLGTVQSGIPDIAMESLTNIKLIKFSRQEAAEILKTDPKLKEHPLLADALQKFSAKIHLE